MNGVAPFLHLGVVAMEKGAFESQLKKDLKYKYNLRPRRGSCRCLMAKVLDCGLEVSEFEIQSR